MANNDPLWMEHANIQKGAFSAKAKRAGMSTAAYAKKKAGAPGKLGKQARLAQTFAKERPKKKAIHKTMSDQMLGARG